MLSEDGRDSASDDEALAVMRKTIFVTIRRLRELARAEVESKGKSPERERDSDEPWECLTRLAELFKSSGALKKHHDLREVLGATMPFLSDLSTCRRRTAAYRLLRYILDRQSWGFMIAAGVEWIIIR